MDGELLEKKDVKKINANIPQSENFDKIHQNFACVGSLASIEPIPEPTYLQKLLASKHEPKEIKHIKAPEKKKYKLNKVKVRSKIYAFANVAKSRKKLNFWTITFPEGLKDKYCYKYFNTWLTRLRYECKLKSYLWVAEQQKNDTTHFHMIVNQYINVSTANTFMKETLLNGHKKKEYKYNLNAIENYNGVDIDKDRKTKRVVNFAEIKRQKTLANYLSKYVTKNDTQHERLTWHCSRDISQLFTSAIITRANTKIFNVLFEIDLYNPCFAVDFISGVYAKQPPEFIFHSLDEINEAIYSLMN